MENILNQPLETIFKDEPDILEHFQDYFNGLKKVGINTIEYYMNCDKERLNKCFSISKFDYETIEYYINKIMKESKSSGRRK